MLSKACRFIATDTVVNVLVSSAAYQVWPDTELARRKMPDVTVLGYLILSEYCATEKLTPSSIMMYHKKTLCVKAHICYVVRAQVLYIAKKNPPPHALTRTEQCIHERNYFGPENTLQ